MPPIILPGGIVLDPHDARAQQLQAHAERLGLDGIQVFRATVVGQRRTYLVLDRLRPVFEHATPDVVIQHLGRMAHGQQVGPGQPVHARAQQRRQQRVAAACRDDQVEAHRNGLPQCEGEAVIPMPSTKDLFGNTCSINIRRCGRTRGSILVV